MTETVVKVPIKVTVEVDMDRVTHCEFVRLRRENASLKAKLDKAKTALLQQQGAAREYAHRAKSAEGVLRERTPRISGRRRMMERDKNDA